MTDFIPVNVPLLDGNEKLYQMNVLIQLDIVKGPLKKFEEEFTKELTETCYSGDKWLARLCYCRIGYWAW